MFLEFVNVKKVLLFLLIAFLIAGCAAPRESVDFDPSRRVCSDYNIRINLIEGAVIGGSAVGFISLIGFAVFYLLGKKSNK